MSSAKNEASPIPCFSNPEVILDDNISNHLFTLDQSVLDKPGLIDSKWDDRGNLKSEQILSFRELQTSVIRCIAYLQSRGIHKGQRVLLMVRPGLELIVICFATFRIGAVPIVIDPGMGLSKFARAVKHSEPDALIGIPAAQVVSRILPASFKSVKRRILIKKRSFLRELESVSLSGYLEVERTEGEDLAAVLFTSGSTGFPKGVCYEHRMFQAQIRLLKEFFQFQPGEIDLPMLPIFALFNPALGMTTVLPDMNPSRPATVVPAKIVAAIDRYKVTNSFGSPVLWRKIGDYCNNLSRDLPTLKRILVAGAAAPTSLYRQFKSILHNGEMFSPYGATECLPVSVISGKEVIEDTAHLSDEGKGICVGQPLTEVQVRVMDPYAETLGEEVARGDIGEIWVHGPSVTEEYDKLPDATADSKVSHEGQCWHRMGDMGYLDEAGRLWFCGRKVEMVSVGDQRFYTECVEGTYMTHRDVRRCALIQWKSEALGTKIALVVEPEIHRAAASKKEQQSLAEDLHKHVKQLSSQVVLNAYFFQKKLPVDVRHNAKIHRLTLARTLSTKTPVTIPDSL